MGLLVDDEGDSGVSSGKAGLEGSLEEEIREGKVTTGLVGKLKPQGLRVWNSSSSGSKRAERQSSQGEKVECGVALKKELERI